MLFSLPPSTESCSDKIAESNGHHMTDVPQESPSKELLDLLVLSYFISSKLLQRQDDKEAHLRHSRQSSLKVFCLAKDPRRPGICFNVYSKDLCMDTDVKQGIFDSSWRQYICLLPFANFLFRSNWNRAAWLAWHTWYKSFPCWGSCQDWTGDQPSPEGDCK